MSFGWQEWSVLRPDIVGPAGVNRIDPALAPIESSLSWLGMPGLTAYFGLIEVGRPRPGDHGRRFGRVGSGRSTGRPNRQARGLSRSGYCRKRRQTQLVPGDRVR